MLLTLAGHNQRPKPSVVSTTIQNHCKTWPERVKMNCRCCGGSTNKFGKFQNVNRIVQRYRCQRCGTTFSETQPLDGVRVDFKQACNVVHLLCEGMGIRAISRFTGLDTKTVMNILASAGQKAAALLDAKIRNVKAEYVSADELVCFVKTKQMNTDENDLEHGQFFTFISVDMFSKLIINWRTDKRTMEACNAFMTDLRQRVPNRFQLATDALLQYKGHAGAVQHAFGNNVDYATEQKVFNTMKPQFKNGFVPMKLIGIRKQRYIGNPRMELATTCHCERTNLSVRLFTRRFTRCTLGYSKTLDALRHAVALFIAHFNFCRVHSAVDSTPAQAAHLTDHVWTIEEMLSETN